MITLHLPGTAALEFELCCRFYTDFFLPTLKTVVARLLGSASEEAYHSCFQDALKKVKKDADVSKWLEKLKKVDNLMKKAKQDARILLFAKFSKYTSVLRNLVSCSSYMQELLVTKKKDRYSVEMESLCFRQDEEKGEAWLIGVYSLLDIPKDKRNNKRKTLTENTRRTRNRKSLPLSSVEGMFFCFLTVL